VRDVPEDHSVLQPLVGKCPSIIRHPLVDTDVRQIPGGVETGHVLEASVDLAGIKDI
jgi:hypothetical protein